MLRSLQVSRCLAVLWIASFFLALAACSTEQFKQVELEMGVEDGDASVSDNPPDVATEVTPVDELPAICQGNPSVVAMHAPPVQVRMDEAYLQEIHAAAEAKRTAYAAPSLWAQRFGIDLESDVIVVAKWMADDSDGGATTNRSSWSVEETLAGTTPGAKLVLVQEAVAGQILSCGGVSRRNSSVVLMLRADSNGEYHVLRDRFGGVGVLSLLNDGLYQIQNGPAISLEELLDEVTK